MKVQLDQQFEKTIIDHCTAASLQYDCGSTRFLQTVTRLGGVGAVKVMLRKGAVSDHFDALQKAGHLELSIEAAVVESKYAALFTDEEVDHCLSLLCEAGYYQIR